MRSRQARGQAMVELVLGSLVFVTILVFGIHFAEIGYLSLKVTEAANSAMWDTTTYQLHDWPGDASAASTAASKAAADATQRYGGLDGRSSLGTRTSISQVFTKFDQVQVQCQTGSGMGFGPDWVTSGGLGYSDNGGLSCGAQANVTVLRFPNQFEERSGGGFFQKRNYTPPGTFVICAIGRASGGACPNPFVSVLDDWGLSGSQCSNNAIIPDLPIPAGNPAYWQMVTNAFGRTGAGMGIAGSNLILSTVTIPPLPFFPGAENAPWLSSIAEPVWVQPQLSEGLPVWPTSPGLVPALYGGIPYTVSYFQRDSCFLGHGC
jgi:hypothetical protein